MYFVAPEKRRDIILDLHERFPSEIKVCEDTKAFKIQNTRVRYMQFVIELAAAIYYSLTDPAAAFKPIAAHIAHVGISSDTDKAWHNILRCKGIYLTASAVFLNAPIILSSYSQVINLVG